jgi:hypothetical protein
MLVGQELDTKHGSLVDVDDMTSFLHTRYDGKDWNNVLGDGQPCTNERLTTDVARSVCEYLFRCDAQDSVRLARLSVDDGSGTVTAANFLYSTDL